MNYMAFAACFTGLVPLSVQQQPRPQVVKTDEAAEYDKKEPRQLSLAGLLRSCVNPLPAVILA